MSLSYDDVPVSPGLDTGERGFAPQRTVNFGVTGPSQSLRSSADFLGQSTQSILVEVNDRQVPIRLSRGWNVSCVGANALSALRGPMASAIHANPAVSAWATIANNRAS